MNNITILAAALLIGLSFITVGCGKKQKPMPTTETKVNVKTTNPIEIAKPQLSENLKFVMNSGWQIIDTNKIYITKSQDFEKAYFIGTLVKNGSQIYNCIWFSNSDTLDGVTMAANDYAINASSMPDARKSQAGIKATDDGYSRINQKLLYDWNSSGK